MKDYQTYQQEKIINQKPQILPSEYFRYQKIKKFIRGKSLFDAGCGNGFFLKLLKDQNLNLTGFDLSPDRVKISQKNASQAKIYQDNIYQIKQKDQSFKTVTCLEVIEHTQKWQNALKEVLRITQKRLLLTVPNNEKIKYEICAHCGKQTPRNRHFTQFNSKIIAQNLDQRKFKLQIIPFGNKLFITLINYLPLLKHFEFIDNILSQLFPQFTRWLLIIVDRKNEK